MQLLIRSRDIAEQIVAGADPTGVTELQVRTQIAWSDFTAGRKRLAASTAEWARFSAAISKVLLTV